MVMKRESGIEVAGRLAGAIHRLHQDADPANLLVEAAKLARKAAGAEEVSLLLIDASGKQLVEHVVAGSQLRPGRTRLRVGAEGITGWVAGHGRTLVVPDVARDSRYVQANPRVKSEAAVPIRQGDRVVGVLNFESRQRNFFRKSDVPLLEFLASQIALGLHISEVTGRGERMRDRLELLHHLARLGNGFMAPDPLLNRVADVLRRGAGIFYVGVFLGDYERQEVVVLAHASARPVDIRVGATQKFGAGLIGTAFKLGETVHVKDVSKDPIYIAKVPGVRSELCVPVRIGEHCLGVLDLQSTDVGGFPPEDVLAVEAVSHLVAPVLQQVATRYAAGRHALSRK